ncbi:MAG: hypothetical protein ACRC10_04695 [Thermoguttaceae bacterium]
MNSVFQKIKHRISKTGFFPTLFYLFGTCFCEKIGIKIIRIYILPESVGKERLTAAVATAAQQGLTFARVNGMEFFSPMDTMAWEAYEPGLVAPYGFPKLFQKGMLCFICRCEEKLAGIVWCAIAPNPFNKKNSDEKIALLQRGNTLPQFRGKGILPTSLNFSCLGIANDREDLPIMVEVSVFNHSSIRGIEKAFFNQLGYRLTLSWPFFHKSFYWKRPKHGPND